MFWKKNQNTNDARERMVERDIKGRGITNERVLEAFRNVKRELFMPSDVQKYAYADEPLPIGKGQTISQPYIVAYMTDMLDPQPDDRVLEVGTGSGYQAAILAEIVGHLYSLEIVSELKERAENLLLNEMGYENISIREGSGFDGWPDEAPFDKIIVTAAPEIFPQKLADQLKIGGRMSIPFGHLHNQRLYLVTRDEEGIHKHPDLPVRFVPMTERD